MIKRGVIDENTPPSQDKPVAKDTDGGGPSKEAADSRIDHPSTRAADAVTDKLKSR